MLAASKVMEQRKSAHAATSESGRPHTPPDSPNAQLDNPFEFAKQFLDALKTIQAPESKETSTVVEFSGPHVDLNPQAAKPTARASKLEIKQVHEIWDPKAYQYRIVESPLVSELNEFDEYVFVDRTRIEKTSLKSTTYVDIKSEGLRDILRTILKNIRWLSLAEDKPSIEQDLLFHYLPELEAYQVGSAKTSVVNRKGADALELLIHTIQGRYKSVMERLVPLLEEGRITYDLLWALFKANNHVISTCSGSGKPTCLTYNMGEEKKTEQGVEYFELQCQYLDFDGKVFGAVIARLIIEKFHGARQIDTLNAFPIKFLLAPEKMRKRLIDRGQKFVSLIGSHHQYYDGHAFFQRDDGLLRVPVKSRIMIDAGQFRKTIPYYPRFYTKKLDYAVDVSSLSTSSTESYSARIKNSVMDLEELGEDDLLICSPTVMGFSLNNKFWGEYAVEDMRSIKWSELLFNSLTIPTGKKEVIMTITKNRLGQPDVDERLGRSGSRPSMAFDDVVEGKGRGLIMLLYGPPGVGKNTDSRSAFRALPSAIILEISAGELSLDAAKLEEQLNNIFETASVWNALLLLDEADVFLQQRSQLTLERNRLVAVFLRKLEFFEGILFLTTNLINDFDGAILNRVHLKMKYEDLDRHSRKSIIAQFLTNIHKGQGPSDFGTEYFDQFACVPLNGREIRNTISTANDLADGKGERMAPAHISQALSANGYVLPLLGNISAEDNLYE